MTSPTTAVNPHPPPSKLGQLDLSILDAERVKRIEQALVEVGDFGEVRLIKVKGRLRFIQKVHSEELHEART